MGLAEKQLKNKKCNYITDVKLLTIKGGYTGIFSVKGSAHALNIILKYHFGALRV